METRTQRNTDGKKINAKETEGGTIKSGEIKCFIDSESGSLKTLAAEEEEEDTNGFEHVCILIDPGASDSVLPLDECK